MRSALRGVDPRAPPAEQSAIIDAPAGCQQVQQTIQLLAERCADLRTVPRRVSTAIPHRRCTDMRTQDVNDPERAVVFGGPQAGSFTSWVPLLRWSEPASVGRERRPSSRRTHAHKSRHRGRFSRRHARTPAG